MPSSSLSVPDDKAETVVLHPKSQEKTASEKKRESRVGRFLIYCHYENGMISNRNMFSLPFSLSALAFVNCISPQREQVGKWSQQARERRKAIKLR